MHTCTVCLQNFPNFLPLPAHYFEVTNKLNVSYSLDEYETLNLGQYQCPACGASDRDRLYALYIKNFVQSSRPLRILEIAPAVGLSDFLKKRPNSVYRSADLYSPLAMDKVDIMDMRIYDDNSFDLIICSHVLEHVQDDRKAIKEIFRILSPGGCAILMVPILKNLEKTKEDPSEKDPVKRIIKFGQDDHVRQYAKKDFISRIEECGFVVGQIEKKDFYALTDGACLFNKYGISDSSVLYVAHKESTVDSIVSFAKKKNPSSPKITIAIPAYKPTFFEAALNSVFDQDFRDFEILVCDDCRTGEIRAKLEPYLHLDKNINVRYFYNEEQLGEARNCGKCIELAQGEYIKFLYDDDVLLPGVLEAQVAVLDKFSDVALVASRRTLIDENGDPLADNVATLKFFDRDVYINGEDLVAFFGYFTLNFIGEPTCVMFRQKDIYPHHASLMDLDGMQMTWLGDVTIYVKLMRLGNIVILEQPGAYFRYSTEQYSHFGRLNPGVGNKSFANFQKTIQKLGWSPSIKNNLVRIASLENPQKYEKFDLESHIRKVIAESAKRLSSQSETSFTYQDWVAQKSKFNSQHPLYERFVDVNSPIEITIIVRTKGDEEKRRATVASIEAQITAPREVVFVNDEGLSQSIKNTSSEHWVLLLCEGDLLENDAIAILQRELVRDENGHKVLACFDHDEIDVNGNCNFPHFLPSLNPDLLLSYPYMGRALLVRANWAQPILNQNKGICELVGAYRLMLQALRDVEAKGFIHIPAVLAHLTPSEPVVFAQTSEVWQELAQILEEHLAITVPNAQVLEGPGVGTFHVIYPLEHMPLVSIVIPTKDLLPFLNRCIDSLLSQTNYSAFEIILVDNGSQTVEAQEFLAGLNQLGSEQIRVVSAPGVFNLARLNNLGASHARGEFVLLLNNDTAIIEPDWLGHMVRHGLREGVGAVGARLLYSDGTLQHAGIVVGLNGPADHPLLGLDNKEPGYLFRAQVAQNFSAVAGACLLVRKSLYENIGGMDESNFTVSYSSVDFCLRIGQAGLRIVWTPLATLLHESAASQKANLETISPEQKIQRFEREQAAMYQHWPSVIANDPAYNPNLSLLKQGYEIETNSLLCFDKFKGLTEHKIAAFHADIQGCGHYRIIQPMQAMLDAGLCRGGASLDIFTPNLALRSGVDVLVFQRPNTETMLAHLKALTALKNVRKIYEVDDHLSKVPVKSVHYDLIPRDLRGKMLKAIGLCDRLVVSTEALAHELRGYNDDVRVAPNRLPLAMWGALPVQRPDPAQRPPKKKPRIGWAGGISHRGDLEMVAAVIKDLADQVDWVFMGMCPDNIRPYIQEFVPGVPTLEYPAKLMALTQDWDLAIAPVESNPFNDCKSNLKLLEYGWCGVPVVCSDVTPYQGHLLATRVKNRYKDWRDAILERVSDLAACHRDGLVLQAQVARDWTLTGQNLQDWYEAWTGQ